MNSAVTSDPTETGGPARPNEPLFAVFARLLDRARPARAVDRRLTGRPGMHADRDALHAVPAAPACMPFRVFL